MIKIKKIIKLFFLIIFLIIAAFIVWIILTEKQKSLN
jgi:phage shock protein PspC (stress-responsive transcriptional regulator)